MAKMPLSVSYKSTRSGQIGQDKRGPNKDPAKSLFSVSNGQTISSRFDDTLLVVRHIVLTSRRSQSFTSFIKQYVFHPTFENDLFTIGFALPATSATPRVLDTVPSVRSNASDWTYQGTRTATPKNNMFNVASYSYLGFVDLEFNTRRLLEHVIRELPLADDGEGCNASIEEEMKSELKKFMGFKGCVLTSTGYAINLVAFPAMVANTICDGKELPLNSTIFLMDSESHSSMLMGAFIASAESRGKIIKFRHNDVGDLEQKLQRIWQSQESSVALASLGNVWVTVEGMYSMSGTLTPLPQIVSLKRKYGFRIYIDEAHSILATGQTGRGVVEHYQRRDDTSQSCDSTSDIDMSDIDMIGGTLSKSFSSVGGFVLTHDPGLTAHIESRITTMQSAAGGSIPTLSIIRTLQILKKPDLISQRLANLRYISNYVAAGLQARGYKILLTIGGPLIAIVLDTIDRLVNFLKLGRNMGLICCGAAFPVAPRGAPRVRLSLTGAHTLEDADEILRLIDEVSTSVGVKGLETSKLKTTLNRPVESIIKSHHGGSVNEKSPSEISDAIDASILALCPPSMRSQCPQSIAIRAAGIAALSRYNVGAAGPRWMSGTFSAHMSLEDFLNKTISSMIPFDSSKDVADIKTSLFTDSRIGIMSIIATAMDGLTSQRAGKGEKHLVLLPKNSGVEIREGAAAAKRSKTVHTQWYTEAPENDQNKGTIADILAQECSSGCSNKLHITLYLDASLLHALSTPPPASLASALAGQLGTLSTLLGSPTRTRRPLSLTLLLSDPYLFTSSLSSTQTMLSVLSTLFPPLFSSPSPASRVQFLLFGAFHSLPDLQGIQGAFCTGSRHLVEKVQILGQGVMYTAMMMPLNAVVIEEGVRLAVSEAGGKGRGEKGEGSLDEGVRDVPFSH